MNRFTPIIPGSRRTAALRRGHTLLEVLAASAIMAIVLVSTLAMLRDSLTSGETIELKQAMTTLATHKMEEQLALGAADFSFANETGSFAPFGYSDLRYSTVRSDNAGLGGIADSLMVVTVVVWQDENGDTVFTAGEPSLTMASKLAKLASYTSLAEGS